MFNRIALSLVVLLLVNFGSLGCSRSKKEYYSAAPVTTYTVVYVDTFGEQDRTELNNSIATIISALLAEHPSVTYNVTINITNSHIHHNRIKNGSVLVECGDENSLPGLYEALCELTRGNNRDKERDKTRDKQLEEENKRRNSR